jgi:natural product biosynthesis luciferase-like monooxygenase protein
MQLSLFYFGNDAAGGRAEGIYQLLLDGARFADRNGFTAVWMPERHFHPFGGIYPNPSVTAAALAGITGNVRLRAGSVVAPLHQPIRIAEEWAVVDNLSGGRVGISFAPGWHRGDFVLAPGRYDSRRADMAAAVRTVRALWRGEEVTGTDGEGRSVPVRLYPRPIQPELPVWITTSGSIETFELAGTVGAHVLTHAATQDLGRLRQKIGRYREVLRANHPERRGHVTLMLHTFLGDRMEAVIEQVREPLLRYLGSSLDLRARNAANGRSTGQRPLGERETRLAVSRAFDRYVTDTGLFGPPERCIQLVDRLGAAGVDELACLIDYGPDLPATMASLTLLAELRERVSC